jgi:hypothetical protein
MAYKKTQTKRNKIKRNKKDTKKRNTNKKRKTLKRRIYNNIYSNGGGAAMSALANDYFYPEEPLFTVPDRVFDEIPHMVSNRCVIIINKIREQILIYNRYINLIVNAIHYHRILKQKIDELINTSTDVIETTNKKFNERIIDLYIRKLILAETAVDDAFAKAKLTCIPLTERMPIVFNGNFNFIITNVADSQIIKSTQTEYGDTVAHYNTVIGIFTAVKRSVIDKHHSATTGDGVVLKALEIAFHPSTMQRMADAGADIEDIEEALNSRNSRNPRTYPTMNS